MSRALSQVVVRKSIVGELHGETAGEIVIPSCDPAAQVGNPRLIKPGSGRGLTAVTCPLSAWPQRSLPDGCRGSAGRLGQSS
jgi:hypothetical protein